MIFHTLALPDIFYSRVAPAPVAAPSVVLYNDSLAAQLGLPDGWGAKEATLEYLAGKRYA